jgi:S1-C subfamily serine protease
LSLGEDGPAARAGVLIGDILVSLDGAAVSEPEELQNVVESHGVGQTVKAGVIRGGVPQTIAIAIGERPRRD